MKRYFFEQQFKRVKTGVAPFDVQEESIAFEVDSLDANPQECLSAAWRHLSQIPGAGYRSGWTGWQPTEYRFYEQGEDDPGVDALRAAAEESFEELRTELPEIADALENPPELPPLSEEAIAELGEGVASGDIEITVDFQEPPADSIDPFVEYGDPIEDYEDEEAPLTHEEWEGAQKSALVEEGHLTPEEAFGGDRIGDAAERLKPWARYKIKNVYDKPEFPVDAVDILEPDFEYADWAEERVSQLWKRRLG